VKRNVLFLLSLIVVFSLLLSACGGQQATQAPAEQPTSGDDAYPAEPVTQPETTTDGQEPGYPMEGATITVGTDATFPPFETVDEATKELTGFDIELMRAIADQNGWQIEFVNQPFDPMMAALGLCQYDVAIAAITITEERKQEMLFSDPYINAGQIVVVRKGETAITGREALSGKTVGAQLGTTGAIEAEKIEGVTFKPYDTYDLAFLDLANGQIDAVIADYPLALDFVGQYPEQVQVAGEPFTEEFYGVAICKNRGDLVEPINTALAALKSNGTVSQLEEKWLVRQGE
jgi:polar amino acid transport system substrate-binding protein